MPILPERHMIANALPLHGYKVDLFSFGINDISNAYISWLNDPEVTQFSNQRFTKHDFDSCMKYMGTFVNSNNLFLSLRRRDNGQAIGTMTVYFALQHGTADVGILIGDRTIWGMGYGQDAWSTMVNWLSCHKAIRKVTAGTLACNQGMITLMERSGMKLEAVRKNQEIVAGKPVDILYYAKWHAS
jgi:ribosomal-protein-alanine N-acetyltransferase